jgi:hypothetical protein
MSPAADNTAPVAPWSLATGDDLHGMTAEVIESDDLAVAEVTRLLHEIDIAVAVKLRADRAHCARALHRADLALLRDRPIPLRRADPVREAA